MTNMPDQHNLFLVTVKLGYQFGLKYSQSFGPITRPVLFSLYRAVRGLRLYWFVIT